MSDIPFLNWDGYMCIVQRSWDLWLAEGITQSCLLPESGSCKTERKHMLAWVVLRLQTLISLEEMLCQVACGPLKLPIFKCLFQLVTCRQCLCFGSEGKTGWDLLPSWVALLSAEGSGSQHSEDQLNIWAGGLSLKRSPVSRVGVGGGSEQDIFQQHPREGVWAETIVSAAPGSAFRSSTVRCHEQHASIYICNH